MTKQSEKYLTPIGEYTLVNAKALLDDFGITTPEAALLSGLEFLPKGERVYGKNNKEIYLEPIALAIYEFVYGVMMCGEAAERMHPNIMTEVAVAKTIFKKIYPDKFDKIF